MAAYKNNSNGTWIAKFYIKGDDGKSHSTTKRGFKTKREALEYIANIRNLDKGNHVIIAATAAARTRYGQTVKQAFQPSAKCSLQFKHAESVFCRYSQNRYDLFICTKKQRKLFPLRSSPSMLGFYTDPPCVKMVCKGIAKLSKIL